MLARIVVVAVIRLVTLILLVTVLVCTSVVVVAVKPGNFGSLNSTFSVSFVDRIWLVWTVEAALMESPLVSSSPR